MHRQPEGGGEALNEERARWDAKYSGRTPGPCDGVSPFVAEALERLGAGAGPALDLAMGAGRHALAAARAGWRVVGLDLSGVAAQQVAAEARAKDLPVQAVVADALTFPVKSAAFGLVICTRFLERELAGRIAGALAPGGHLIFETFTVEQPSLGWGPKNPAFLLSPNELLHLFPGLHVLEYRERVDAKLGATASLLARR